MNTAVYQDRSLAEILRDLKEELQEFVQTRMALVRRELAQQASIIKSAIPMALAGALFLSTAFLLFTLALVALVAVGFGDSPYRWFFALLIVGILWSVGGSTALYFASRRLSRQTMIPRRTVEVLSADKIWLQKETKEARNAI